VKSAIALAVLLLAGACKEKPAPAPKPRGVELSAFEKDVLLGLDSLGSKPEARPFLKALESKGLLKTLKTSPTQEDLRRFQKVLASHATGSSFIRVPEKPAEPSCGPGQESKPTPSLLTPQAEDPTCAPDQKTHIRIGP